MISTRERIGMPGISMAREFLEVISWGARSVIKYSASLAEGVGRTLKHPAAIAGGCGRLLGCPGGAPEDRKGTQDARRRSPQSSNPFPILRRASTGLFLHYPLYIIRRQGGAWYFHAAEPFMQGQVETCSIHVIVEGNAKPLAEKLRIAAG